jgi:glutathione synthase/RimK-type ligase-like ATP-grasp enzyme
MKAKVLIVAARHTREVDGVIDRLRDRNLDVVRFSICQYPEFAEISWDPLHARYAYGGPHAAWLCDLSGWSVESKLTGLERETSLAECLAFAEGTLLSLETNWLNSPQATRVASRKLLQLKLACELGFRVPETCVTNSPEDARAFCRKHTTVVAKALASGFVTYGGKNLKFYTRRIRADSTDLFEALHLGPLILQREIAKKEEIRVIVVDNEAFAVRLDLRSISNVEVDIRQLDYKRHEESFSPCLDRTDLITLSKQVVRELGLSYGGIDWAIDSSGNAYFLECNPLGAFKWFEMRSEQDITGSIADALERRCLR